MTNSKQIRWNNLSLNLPEEWEVIVKEKYHLILERELKPFLEIRWQSPDSNKANAHNKKIIKQLENEIGSPSPPHLIDRLPDALKQRFRVQAFDLKNSEGEQALLLLNCNTCATPILIRLYQGSLAWLTANPFVLYSLNCHPDGADRGIWQIQDIFFSVPSGFELTSCSFLFGLSNLFFKSRSSDLHVCRLAPASHHLQQNSLQTLFETFCSAPPGKQHGADSLTLRYRHLPTFTEQAWSRIKRGRPYQSASFTHFPDHDRILGYSITSIRPLADELESMINNGYGIVQEKEKRTTSNP